MRIPLLKFMGGKYNVRIFLLFILPLFFICTKSLSQELKFTHVLGSESNHDAFLSMAQDKYGFMWFTRKLGGLERYDGSEVKSYLHDPYDSNSLADNWVECIVIDNDNMFWLGTFGSGLDRFDPSTNIFFHFRHNDQDGTSLSNDTITALLADRSGNLWVGSMGGLDLLDKKTGKFKHYSNDPHDSESISNNEVRVIYEDLSGKIWVGCGRPYAGQFQTPADGGLNALNKTTGKFTRYMHDDANPGSIASNKVRAILEDSKGNFWIGTRDDGLQTLDRKTGVFTHYYYDPAHPEKLSRPQQTFGNGVPLDHIAFIKEDPAGNIIIGTHYQGINYYNTSTKKITHYGYQYNNVKNVIIADTATGLTQTYLWYSFTSNDGLIWIATSGQGNVFTINPNQTYLPYYTLNEKKPDANSFYCEKNGNVLWIGTDQGLFRKDLKTNEQKVWKHDPSNQNSLCNDTVSSIKADSEGKLWMGTANGISRFDPVTNKFTSWRHDDKNSGSLSSNNIFYLFFDHEKNLWVGTANTGVDKLNIQTGVFSNYRYDIMNTNSISNDFIYSICEDADHTIWIGTDYGLNSLDIKTGKIAHYLPNSVIHSVYTDMSGKTWAAISKGIYYFDREHKVFQPFIITNRNEEIPGVINIIEDKNKNLWLSTFNRVIKINDTRDAVKIYDESNGVQFNGFFNADNFVDEKGQVFLGDQNGYYAFYPDEVKDKSPPPVINFTSFKIGDQEIKPGKNSQLSSAIWDTKEIMLGFKENNFSFEFTAISYVSTGNYKFQYKMENYDNVWRNIGNERKSYFFNIEPGKYIFHVRGIRKDGVWGEKEITIIILPPWWRTWWAYTFYAILFVVVSVFANRFIRNRILEKEKIKAREKELEHAKEIEKAYTELKLTQAQLIQSEKMASLGELTAGIAHEIQNPLNFVNNFSEVNKELLAEMNAEIEKGNLDEVKSIAKDISDNEEKINHHGKRADFIVKGMLQHSRTSTGQKELTDINALADEYLRLAYHGLRGKDKWFTATIQTDFDHSIGKTNIIPQDIGRVLLNLYNNAFYAVNEKKQTAVEGYEPTVSVSTKMIGDKPGSHRIEIKIKDNGNGIPQNIVQKIFQPFFTTKPTGQGTGLGLSLAYDIVKAHGGEIKVESKQGQFSEFIITLPI